MSKTRSIARKIKQTAYSRAFLLTDRCPVCFGYAKRVWYSRNVYKCTRPSCATKVRLPRFMDGVV